jgi:hypothetical protein
VTGADDGHDERSPFFSAPASSPSPLGGDAGLDGEQVECPSLPSAPGNPPPPARGIAGRPPAALGGRPDQAPSPPPGDHSTPQGCRSGEGHDPASAGSASLALAGQDWRDAVKREQSRQARDRRNQRGRRRAATRQQPGMIRREPPDRDGAA